MTGRKTARTAQVLSARSRFHAIVETLETRQLLAAAVWSGAGDNVTWNSTYNWVDGRIPQTGDDVTIDAPFGATLELPFMLPTLNSLTSRTPLRTNSGGYLSYLTVGEANIDGTFNIGPQTRLVGGVWNANIVAAGEGVVFENTTINGTLSGAEGFSTTAYVIGDLTLNGTIELYATDYSHFALGFTAAGEHHLYGNATIRGTTTSATRRPALFGEGGILAPTVTVTGKLDIGNLVNQGTVDAEFVKLQNVQNQGLIRTSGGTIEFAGELKTSDIGRIEALTGVVNFRGVTLDNTDAFLVLNQVAQLNLSYTTIIGGTVRMVAGQCVADYDVTFQGTRLAGEIVAKSLIFRGGLELDNAVVRVPGWFRAGDDMAITGSGTVVLEDGNFGGVNGVTLRIGAGVTFRGYGAATDSVRSRSYIINEGEIVADVPGMFISLFAEGITNYGTIAQDGGYVLMGAVGTIDNRGTLAVRNITGGNLVNSGTIEESQKFEIDSLSLDGHSWQTTLFSQYIIANGLSGNTAGAGAANLGHVSLAGALEVMGLDLGATLDAFGSTFVYESLKISNGSLVDLRDNALGTAPEALYVKTLAVTGTLDLGGLHIYVGALAPGGTFTNGTVEVIPDAGRLVYGSVMPGRISAAGQVDEWTFHANAGRTVGIRVNPSWYVQQMGDVFTSLDWVDVTILNAQGEVVWSGTQSFRGQELGPDALVLDISGEYRIRVQAPAWSSGSMGWYGVSVHDITDSVRVITPNERMVGHLETSIPATWLLAASAGDQIRLDIIAPTGAVEYALTDPNGTELFTGLYQDSQPITLSMSGTYKLSARLRGFPGNYSFQIARTNVTDLAVNTSATANLITSNQTHLYRINLTDGKPLKLTLTDNQTANLLQLYARLGQPPTLSEYGYRADAPGGEQEILIPAGSGTWYVMVTSDYIVLPDTYTLTATTADVFITSVTPAQAASNQPFTVEVRGAGFVSGTSVLLVGPQVHSPQQLTIDDFTRLTARFGSVPAGTYSLRITRPGGTPVVQPNAVTVVNNGQARLVTDIIAPSDFGLNAPATIYVEYANTGNIPMPAPMLVFGTADPDGSDNPLLTLDQSRMAAGIWSSARPDGFASSVAFIAQGRTPGMLLPGERLKMPVYYAGLPSSTSDGFLELKVAIYEASDTTPIPWDSMRDKLKPESMSATTWSRLYQRVQAQVGSTWGDYVSAMNANASYLYRMGEMTVDIESLWDFQVMLADGIGPISRLDTSIDLSLPAPGPRLEVARAYDVQASQRSTDGWFGRGWWSTWMTSLKKDVDGSVTIIGQGGSERRFQPDSRGEGFFSENGVLSTLTDNGDYTYTLKYPDDSSLKFSAAGSLIRMRDANGHTIEGTYLGGRLQKLTHSNGAFLTFTWNDDGHITSVSDSTGRSVTYTYHWSGKYLSSVQYADGTTSNYAYETNEGLASNDALVDVQLPTGAHNRFSYDAGGRLTGIWKEDGLEKLTLSYEDSGTVKVTNLAGGSVSYSYNSRGQLLRVRDALGHTTSYTYNDFGQLASIENAPGQQQVFAYNKRHRLSSYTDANGKTIRFAYYVGEHKPGIFTDSRDNATYYDWDADGNLRAVDYMDRSAQEFFRGEHGELLKHINRRGQAVEYSYNAAGQITSRKLPDGTTLSYTYDARGNMTSATDASGTTTYEYDAANNMTRVNYPNGRFLSYSYNAIGLRTEMTDHAGFTTRYVYNDARRLWKVTDGSDSVLVTYEYNAAGLVTRQTNANGTWTTREYDLNGSITHLVNYAAGGAVTSRFDYTYDSLGRCTQVQTEDGAWSYTYDARGQLIRAVFASSNGSIANQDLAYTYDSDGNRTATIINGATQNYTTNTLDQYTAVGNATYAYDAGGNLISRTVGGVTTTYSYDVLGLLTGVTSGTDKWNYEYNALGQRTAAIHNGVRTEYLLDPASPHTVVGEYVNGTLLANYSYGLSLAGRVAGGAMSYYQYDSLGSTAGVTDASGAEVNEYAYLPFGEILSQTEAFDNRFTFVGGAGVAEESNGLYFMRARYYMPSTGVFTTPDPLGTRQPTLYGYAYANPVSLSDPSGLDAKGFGQGWGSYYKNMGNFKVADAENAVDRGTNALNKISKEGNGLAWDLMSSSGGNMVPDGWYGVYEIFDLAKTLFDLSSGIDEGITEADKAKPGSDGDSGSDQQSSSRGSRGGPTPGTSGGRPGSSAGPRVATSRDPNQLLGPDGFGPENYVTADALLSYRIDFENDATATAPAQSVVITNRLSADLDWQTFDITGVGFGDTMISVDEHTRQYQGVVPMTYNGQTFDVEIRTNLNLSTGVLTARFDSVDPETNLPPDVLTGFLPPENGTGRGMGFITYTIRPAANVANNTAIRNIATIQFDGGEIIATNQIDPHDPTKGTNPAAEALVTIDKANPRTRVQALPATSNPSFTVRWLTDDNGTSGIASYDVYVSVNGAPFSLWLNDTTQTSAQYAGIAGKTYAFYTVAVDNLGHTEAVPASADTQTTTQQAAPGPLTVNGTAGNDTITLVVSGTDLAVTINGTTTHRDVASVTTITINGLAGHDRITADIPLAVSLFGGAGNDTITTGAGNDLVYGNEDDDSIVANDGMDTIYGNFGNDVIAGGLKRDSILAGIGNDVVTAGDGPDTVLGGDGTDVLRGGKGADYIEGRGKSDTIYGGVGADYLIGGAGGDMIYGETDDDRIDVSPAPVFHDFVDGGAGNDLALYDDDDTTTGIEGLLS